MIRPIISGIESDGSDSAPQPPTQPTAPTHICPYCDQRHAGSIRQSGPALAHLLAAAQSAEKSLDRFLQLHDPRGSDLKALEALRAALAPFGA